MRLTCTKSEELALDFGKMDVSADDVAVLELLETSGWASRCSLSASFGLAIQLSPHRQLVHQLSGLHKY